jgi:hypothetical protein
MKKAASPGIAGAHPFGTSQGISGQCGSSPASTVSVEELKPGNPVSSRSATKPVPHSAVSLSQVAGSGDSADAVRTFGNHAYISPIKLRRMMRNASDLETRLKLQQLSNKALLGRWACTPLYQMRRTMPALRRSRFCWLPAALGS